MILQAPLGNERWVGRADVLQRVENASALGAWSYEPFELHRREDKSVWWDVYRLAELSSDGIPDQAAALGGLEWVERVGGTKKCCRYRNAFCRYLELAQSPIMIVAP